MLTNSFQVCVSNIFSVCLFSFQIACLVPVDQFQLYKRLKFERGVNLLVSITFVFNVSVEAAVLHTAETILLGKLKKRQEDTFVLKEFKSNH